MAENNFDSEFLMDTRKNDEDIFRAAINSKHTEALNFSELRSVGSSQHRLLFRATCIDDEVRHGLDPLCEFIQKKFLFQTKLKFKRSVLFKKKISETFRHLKAQILYMRNDGCLKVPRYVAREMKALKGDPDMSFYGNYNWYYTGGCLHHLHTNQTQLLLFVDGKSRDNLCIASLKDDSVWGIDTSCMQRGVASPGEEIFQVVGVEYSPLTLIGTRQKHECTVFWLQDWNIERSITECFSVDSGVPFTSFDISSVHKELCTINVRQGMSFWDIPEKKDPMTIYFPSDNPRYDKWHSLWYSADPSVITVAGRKSCQWIDRRTSGPNNSLKLTCFRDTQHDEEISVHFASKRSPYLMYIGTDVNLFMVDIRSLESPVCRWPHEMISPPLYSSVISLQGEKEIACVGNHYPGNVVLAFSSNSEVYSLFEIQSLEDSLLSSQACGLCLDPSVRPRMMCSLTGLTSIKSDRSSNVELLTQTIASDIFSQALLDNKADTDCLNLSDLATTKESLIASERWNMSELHKSLSKIDVEKHNTKQNFKRVKAKQVWQLSKEELSEYKDVLSSIILQEWEIGLGEDDTVHISSDQKVSEWLNAYNFKSLHESFEEKEYSWEKG